VKRVCRKIGRLELYVGGMFAEKSTALIRQGKRHILAGRKVVFLKPDIDNRYSDDEVVTHDGIAHKAIKVKIFKGYPVGEQGTCQHLNRIPEVRSADVVCIDEIQFFPEAVIPMIDELIYSGKLVYCAGLDMDRFGRPFGIVPILMARAEHVEKFHAVCAFCGEDAWVTIGTDKLQNDEQVNVGNDYIPACRTCAYRYGGVK
jgi:thymidine kinase